MVGTNHGKKPALVGYQLILIPAQRLLKPLFLGYEDLRHCSGYLYGNFFSKIYNISLFIKKNLEYI
jgi:hypothetical protein